MLRTAAALVTLCLIPLHAVVAKDYSAVPGFEFELAYSYLGVSAGSDFVAVGDWNDNGDRFPLYTKSESSAVGAQAGARFFLGSIDNTGFGLAARFGPSTAKMAIDWTSGGQDVDEANYFFSVGAGALYKLALLSPSSGRGLYLIPELGLEYDFFSSSPKEEGEEDNKDSFSIASPALLLRLAAEFDVTDTVGLFTGFEYHMQFAWSASRTFQDGSSVDGDLEGSASLYRFVLGATF